MIWSVSQGRSNVILRVIAEASIPVRDNHRPKSFQIAYWMCDAIGKFTVNRMKSPNTGHSIADLVELPITSHSE